MISVPDVGVQNCALYALAGFTGVICGAYFQQEATIRQMFVMIRKDPYVFHYRHKLYPLVSTFRTDHEARLWHRSQCLTDKIRDFFLFPLYDVLNNFFFYKKPPMISPDLLNMAKYGLPGTENLYVHQDYVVSQDLRTNSPKWMCEHLRGNYKKLSMDDDDESLHLRYNDVFVLSCGATRNCKAFQRVIWRTLENHISEITEKFGSVYVYSGPIYLPTWHPDEIWSLDYQIVDWIPLPMPSHYFKVLIIDPQQPGSTPYMEGYMIDNKNSTSTNSQKLCDYLCDIAEIERYTGLRFFDGIQSVVRFKKDKYKIEIPTSRFLSEE